MVDYEAQGACFLADTETTLTCQRGSKSPDWELGRPFFVRLRNGGSVTLAHGRHWVVSLQRGGRTFVFDFWESIASYVKAAGRNVTGPSGSRVYSVREWYPDTVRNPPTPYDILSCISSVQFTPIDFAEFCAEYGYSDDSIRAQECWKECLHQRAGLERLYSADELARLADIN